jgi:hypothetical protein
MSIPALKKRQTLSEIVYSTHGKAIAVEYMSKKILPLFSYLTGLLVIFIYLNFAVGLVHFSQFLTLLLAFAIAPAVLGGIVEIYAELSRIDSRPILRLSTLYLIIGFAFLLLMLVVQQAIFLSMEEFIANEPNEANRNILKLILKGLNRVQLGIDVAFDIFYSLGLVLLSIALLKHKGFGMPLVVYGVASGSLLLILNLYTFPIPPKDANLFDVGPFTVVWWIWFIVQGIKRKKSVDKDPVPEPVS